MTFSVDTLLKPPDHEVRRDAFLTVALPVVKELVAATPFEVVELKKFFDPVSPRPDDDFLGLLSDIADKDSAQRSGVELLVNKPITAEDYLYILDDHFAEIVAGIEEMAIKYGGKISPKLFDTDFEHRFDVMTGDYQRSWFVWWK